MPEETMQARGPEAPLANIRILVTRAALQAGDLVREIEKYGGMAVLFPTIEIHPARSWDECDRAIDERAMYDGLIFSSTNGVQYFCERWSGRGLPIRELRSKMICVVGEKTKQAAINLGLTVTVMPRKCTAADLARTVSGEHPGGKRYLFPRGDLGNDALTGRLTIRGARVDCVIVYETRRSQPGSGQRVRTMLLEGGIQVVTFTSPSTFNNFVSLFSCDDIARLRPLTKFAAIGPATAAAISRRGMGIDIMPVDSSVESLLKSIVSYYASDNG